MRTLSFHVSAHNAMKWQTTRTIWSILLNT